MMVDEFIDRTGFEPMADEYAEIEREYVETDIDKDSFCAEWKKRGGIYKVMKARAKRINGLELELRKANIKLAKIKSIIE